VNFVDEDEEIRDKDRLFWSIVLIPDMMYLISYGTLFWHLFKLLLEGHIHISSEVYIPYERHKGLGYRILGIGFVCYLLLQILFSVLFLVQEMSFIDLVLQLSVIVIIICTSAMIFLLFVMIKFSGQPYQNEEYKRKIRALIFVVLVWSILKIIRAGFGLTRNKDSNFIRKVLEGVSFEEGNKWESLRFMIIFLVCEIVPFLMVLDSNMLKIFKLRARKDDSFISVSFAHEEEDEEEKIFPHVTSSPILGQTDNTRKSRIGDKNEEIKDQGLGLNNKESFATDKSRHKDNSINVRDDVSFGKHRESYDNLAATTGDLSKTMYQRRSNKANPKRFVRKIKEIIVTSKNDFELGEEFTPKLLHKPKKKLGKRFGKMFNAVLKGEKVTCRLIQFDRLTSYLTEDLYEEIQITNSICDDNIVKIKGLFIENSKVYLFYPTLVSLYEYIHIQKKKMTNKEKMEIAIQIVESLKKIYDCRLNLIHGHLSSRNLFITKIVDDDSIKPNIRIGDLGDMSIRQHAKIFYDYEIRNTWSSPEVLVDSNIAFTARKQSMDIYSVGMLVWEIFSNIVPFADNIEAANVFVNEKNCRPKIKSNPSDSDEEGTDYVPNDVADVIKK
jgi:hypothetical protein